MPQDEKPYTRAEKYRMRLESASTPARQGNIAVTDFATIAPAPPTTKYYLPALNSNWSGVGLYLSPRPNIPDNITPQAKRVHAPEDTMARDKRFSTISAQSKSSGEKSYATSSTLYEGGVHCQSNVKLPGYWTHARSAALAKQAKVKRLAEESDYEVKGMPTNTKSNIAVCYESPLDKARKAMAMSKRKEKDDEKSRRGFRAWFRRKV